jgi:rod shape determining protein RodA
MEGHELSEGVARETWGRWLADERDPLVAPVVGLAMRNPRPKDPFLWICPLLLWLFGLMGLWSLSRGSNYPIELAGRQAVIGLLGLAAGALCARQRWSTITRALPWALGFSVLTLGAVLVFGTTINGATRWLQLGPVGSFQPSELAKLVAMLWTAQLMCKARDPKRGLLTVLALVGLLAGLIFLQPDLGTALVLAGTCVVLAFIGGAPWKPLAALGATGALVLPWFLDEYQWQRIHIFLDPESDPIGAGWNLEQSKIAIGSGGLWGKGAFLGLQGPLDFLPEAHSDFIFSVLNEEYGFLGCALILLLLATLVGRLFWHASMTPHPLRRLVLIGIGLHFAFHTLLNAGMTVGIAPVTGSPLPFVSFGGTALLVNFLAIGIAESILRAQRF